MQIIISSSCDCLVCRFGVGLPWTVVRSPHEEQFRKDHQEGVPHPGGHLVSGGRPGRVISYQTFKLLSNFLLEPSIFINLPSHHNITQQNNLPIVAM